MAASSVVKLFNVIEDIFLGQITRFVDAFFDTFFFQTAKKGLGYSVVPTVSTPTHAGFKLVGFTKSQPIITAVLGGFNWSLQHL